MFVVDPVVRPKKEIFENTIQVVGVAGVIGSLVFVGLELRQSQEIAIAGQFQARANISIQGIYTWLETGMDWQSVTFDGNSQYNEELSSFDIARRNYTHVMWFILENDFFQYSQELMPDNMWAAKLNTIRLFYYQCDTREIYLTRKSLFSREFIREVESIPDECRE